MQPRLFPSHGKLLSALSLAILATGVTPSWGDDTGILSRLFRLGGGSTDSSPSTGTAAPNQSGSLPYGHASGATGSALPRNGISPLAPEPMISNFNGLPQTPVTTPPVPDGPSQRLAPRPRVSPAVTSADPVLTRFALGRSNDGSQFGMFLQIFADGTVVDSEGVHRVRPADLRPIVETVQSGELYRIKGHCGAPSSDFIEYVHVVIYERRLGRLNAHAFSYTGNTQGCDHAVRHLHTVLENLQAKISRQGGVTNARAGGGAASAPTPVGPLPMPAPEGSSVIPGGSAPAFGPRPDGQPNAPAVNPGSGDIIPLTPVESSH
jgi:hypothetical protein